MRIQNSVAAMADKLHKGAELTENVKKAEAEAANNGFQAPEVPEVSAEVQQIFATRRENKKTMLHPQMVTQK